MKSHTFSGPGRRGVTLAAVTGLLAPAVLVVAASPVAAASPDGSRGPTGVSGESAAAGAASPATAVAAEANQVLFSQSHLGPSTCAPVLNVSTTEGQVTLRSQDTGWYQANGFHDPSNRNYIVGIFDAFGEGPIGYRDFFVFDTADLPGTVTSARLDVTQTGGCSNGIGEPSTYWLNDVSTPVGELVAGHDRDEAGRAIYADLRQGEPYGRPVITDPNADVSVDLTPAGVAAVEAADGLFAVGGSYRGPDADTTLTADPVEGDGVGNDGVTLTATVAGEPGSAGSGTPTGTVDFTQDGSAVADCTDVVLAPGEGEEATATCEVPSLRPGVYDFAATYSGDERYGVGQPGRASYDGRLTPAVDVAVEDETEGTYRTEEVALTSEVTGGEGESAPSGTRLRRRRPAGRGLPGRDAGRGRGHGPSARPRARPPSTDRRAHGHQPLRRRRHLPRWGGWPGGGRRARRRAHDHRRGDLGRRAERGGVVPGGGHGHLHL